MNYKNFSSPPIYPKTKIIYLICILLFISVLILLPYLKIDVSIRSYAHVRPASEVSILKSVSSGRIKVSYLLENKKVKEGDTLYILESEKLSEQEKYLNENISLMEGFIEDARLVIEASNSSTKVSSTFSSGLYQQSYFLYNQKLKEAQAQLNKAKQAYNRQHKLYKEQVIAPMEFEVFQFEFDKAKNDLELLKQSQLSQWQNELRNYEQDLRDLQSQLAQIQKEKDNLIIKAPISGSVQNLAGIYTGSIVFVNQDLAQISPDTTLIVESFVNPSDIGLLKQNMPARFQIDAFNHNQWGLATGKVIDISSDIHIVNEAPVFKVKCSLDKEYLQLKNGHKGYLKKGMTLRSRFMVTERTLWQLLFDKVDNWLNPNLSNI